MVAKVKDLGQGFWGGINEREVFLCIVLGAAEIPTTAFAMG